MMAVRSKSVEILARSLFRELTAQGYDAREVLSLATALLGEVTRAVAASSGAAR